MEGKPLEQLLNTTSVIYQDDHTFVKERKEYVGSLKIAFAKYPELYLESDKTGLADKSLKNIFEKYYEISI